MAAPPTLDAAQFWRGQLVKRRVAVQDVVAVLVKALGSAVVTFVLAKALKVVARRKALLGGFPGPEPASLAQGNCAAVRAAGGLGPAFFEQLHDEHGELARFVLGPAGLCLSVATASGQAEAIAKCPGAPRQSSLSNAVLGLDNIALAHDGTAPCGAGPCREMLGSEHQLRLLHTAVRETFRRAASRWALGQPVDVHAQLGPLVCEAVGSALLNTDLVAFGGAARLFALHAKLDKWSSAWAYTPVAPRWDADYLKFEAAAIEWRRRCAELLEKRRDEIALWPEKYAHDRCALTVLVTGGPGAGPSAPLSKREAVSTLSAVLGAAISATRVAAFWCLFLLARNQGSQQRLLAELDRELGNGEPSLERARECSFLGAVVRESSRVRSTIPVLERICDADGVRLGPEGQGVPRGTRVYLPVFLALKDAAAFGAPQQFAPERFLDPCSGKLGSQREALMLLDGQLGLEASCVAAEFRNAFLRCMLATVLGDTSVHLVNPAEQGDFCIEAGLAQPVRPGPLWFRPRARLSRPAT